jgi:hypothetical protein
MLDYNWALMIASMSIAAKLLRINIVALLVLELLHLLHLLLLLLLLMLLLLLLSRGINLLLNVHIVLRGRSLLLCLAHNIE